MVPSGPTQRQLRVGEEVRHALAAALRDGGSDEPELFDASITVTEVRVSPDLKHATAYVMPLGGRNAPALLAALRRAKPHFRHQIAKALKNLRNVPDLRFELDTSFETGARIEDLLKQPR